jgi:hypothetical protein
MGFGYGPPTIVTDGLVFAVDAGNPKSFTPDTLPVSDLVNYISNNTGTIINNGTGDEIGYSSDDGGSWLYDGTDDTIEFDPLPVLSGKDNLTISCWHKTEASVTTIESLYGNTAGGFHGIWCGLYYTATNFLYFEIGNGVNEYVYSASLSTVMPKGFWYDLTLVLDASETDAMDKWKIYVNGEKIATLANGIFEGTSTSASNLQLGNDKTSYNFPFNGNIAKFLIYDRSLTAAEVLHNYNAQKSRFGL